MSVCSNLTTMYSIMTPKSILSPRAVCHSHSCSSSWLLTVLVRGQIFGPTYSNRLPVVFRALTWTCLLHLKQYLCLTSLPHHPEAPHSLELTINLYFGLLFKINNNKQTNNTKQFHYNHKYTHAYVHVFSFTIICTYIHTYICTFALIHTGML